MSFGDIFSKREKRKNSDPSSQSLTYDELPQPLRVQIIHIWNEALYILRDDNWSCTNGYVDPLGIWDLIFSEFIREKGLFKLSDNCRNPQGQCCNYLLNAEVEDAIDLVEMVFRVINSDARREDYRIRPWESLDSDKAIEELNYRFLEHNVGYAFEGNCIIRIDSRHLHKEVVEPTFALLFEMGDSFRGPLAEFETAHVQHRSGKTKESIVFACNAFESTLKSICTVNKWEYDKNKDTSQKLIKIVLQNGLIPTFFENQLNLLQSLMESGVPTARNRMAAHGQGPTPTEIPPHLATYVLNLTASTLLLLLQSHLRLVKRISS